MSATKHEPTAGLAAPGETLPEVATREEVSKFTRVAAQTLARWATEGKGPRFRKAGGRVLYRRADVLAWLDSLDIGGEAM